MGSVYKILAKTLAYRLKVVIVEMISPNQSAFLEGRQSINWVLITNKCMDEIIKRGSQVFFISWISKKLMTELIGIFSITCLGGWATAINGVHG